MRFVAFTNYLINHPWQTAVLTFAITFATFFIPIIGIFGILIAALITLCKSPREGAFLTALTLLPYLISFFFSVHAVQPLVLWAAMGVAIFSNLLTYIFALLLRRQSSWSLILQTAALLGVLVVSLVHLAYPATAEWWGNQLQTYYLQAQAAMADTLKKPAAVPSEIQLQAINITKQYATGLMVAAVLFNAIMQLIIARWWQCAVFMPGQLRKELHRITLSQLAAFLFLASLILAYWGNSVVLDIMPILYILFGAAGLSFIHYLFGLMKSPTVWFWLILFYVMLIFAMPTSIVLIAIVALLDSWFDLRKRFTKV